MLPGTKSPLARRISHLAPEGAYAVLARALELEARGRRILHLEIGQPDFPTPEVIKAAGIRAIRDNRTRYTDPSGLAELRARIAEVAGRQRAIELDPGSVIVGPGTKPALLMTAFALLEPGDEVILPDPGFPTYEAVVRLTGATPIRVPLLEARNFRLDLSVFERSLSRKTRLIVLNSPSNPTGGVLSDEDLAEIAVGVQAVGAWVLSDEIYSRLVYEGRRSAPSILVEKGMAERAILVDGFSKTYSMTGWRLGFLIAPPQLAERLQLLATHFVGPAAEFTQVAALEALDGAQEDVETMIEEYEERRNRLVDLLNGIPGMSVRAPLGAFYVFPNVASYGLPAATIQRRLLEEQGVAALAGTDFGPAGEGHLRLCFATSIGTIEEAADRMGRFFRKG